MPATESTPPEPGSEKSDGFKLEELGLAGTVVAAIGGGLGALGFVAFFGAAILWLRMKEAGLPANEALAVIPRSVLIATGASFVVPALLIALAFLLVVYLLAAVALGVSRGRVSAQLAELTKAREKVEETKEDAAKLQSAADVAPPDSTQKIADQVVAAVAEHREAKNEEAEKEKELQEKAKESAVYRAAAASRMVIPLVGTILLFLGGTGFLICHFSLPTWSEIALGVTAAALMASCIAVSLHKENFAWFAAATFLAVCTMAGMLTYFRTVADSKAEPAALLRTGGAPIFGVYVAQTGDRVYLGTSQPGGLTRLEAVSRDEVVDLAIGALLPPDQARRRSRSLALQLCTRAQLRPPVREVAEDGTVKPPDETPSGCTEGDLAWLQKQAAAER